MTLLTNEQQELYENAKICYICKEMFEDKYANNKKCRKVRGQCITQMNIEVLHLAYVT